MCNPINNKLMLTVIGFMLMTFGGSSVSAAQGGFGSTKATGNMLVEYVHKTWLRASVSSNDINFGSNDPKRGVGSSKEVTLCVHDTAGGKYRFSIQSLTGYNTSARENSGAFALQNGPYSAYYSVYFHQGSGAEYFLTDERNPYNKQDRDTAVENLRVSTTESCSSDDLVHLRFQLDTDLPEPGLYTGAVVLRVEPM